MNSAQEGTQALLTLKQLPPRAVFQDLFAVRAQASLSAAAAVAGCAADNDVLLSGVREVQQLTSAALGQPLFSKHQLAKLCQVCLTLTLLHCMGSVVLAESGFCDLGLSMTGCQVQLASGVVCVLLDACTSGLAETEAKQHEWCRNIFAATV